jgi:DNA helicase II / ATP-dependent DNA helicase PcrA
MRDSVYGWRSAEVENLQKMRHGMSHIFQYDCIYSNPMRQFKTDFPKTEQILLEDNYRSTGSILDLSLAIVGQGES